MKQIKKLAALALALIMVLSLATTAFAAEEETGPFTVKVKNATGHEYVIYQIFTGDLAVTKNDKNEEIEILSNIKYGTDYVPEGKKVGDDAEVPADPTSIVPTGKGTAMDTEGDVATATVEEAGYYMIVDVTEPLPGQDTRSAVMFQVVGDTEITSKHTGTTIEKKVKDINDSTGEVPTDNKGSEWIDSADYDIKDTVPFKSTANFEGLDNYETYKVVFTDTMSMGLTYNENMKVYVNGEEKTTAFDIAVAPCTDTTGDYVGGTVITVTCDDITELTGENAAQIVLEYSATLNEDAKLGAPGNPNKIKVTTKPDGSGETPEDVNIVFTYKVEANKYADEVKDENKLTGAGFTLYKWYGTAESGEWRAIGAEVKGEALTTFEWKGIDDGKYKLVETTTPAGYNTIDPIEFEVVAAHVIVAANPTLTSLSGNAATGEVTFKALDKNEGLSTDVINESGTVLPETGGMGTTLFYIFGAILMVGAAVLLVTKKRMANAA